MWVKICGIQDVETAQMIADLGASALGLNFYAPSPRSIELSTAHEIKAALSHKGISLVGLFVKHTLSEVISICRELSPHMVQLHGDEPPEFLAELSQHFPDIEIIWAFRTQDPDLNHLSDFLTKCDQYSKRPDYILIDAYSPQAYGGTGQLVPWEMIKENYLYDEWPALILAGGLTPENVHEAIQTVTPFGVDTASGVESAPGIKSQVMVEAFVNQAKKK
ncbi:phosphoribosylanthranilate isomerase [Gimesia aquarii]|uniref:N-(5'-phosphoribosyl)anthranilate isomerase n=1 Tax=Gimesia aquarii TaxID=2527964 RepID=A0A517VVQ6_9PLAN|nr:phosphoribosylanthranilate isomerase [Gimesia aquarii]QDT97081.1 N-(5'-phosphoribosyl)anthranilate isomerase [Gimesia aquarii]